LFEETRLLLALEGGTLSADGTVLDKPSSEEGKTELVGYFWSGKHGRAVKGLCLVTLLYTDANGVCLPVNCRVVDKAEGKTNNVGGLRPALVSAGPLVLGPGQPQVPQESGAGLSDRPGKEPHRQ
jgi:hypothetical protein